VASITQAALGAAVGEAILGKKIGNKGAILGAIVGTIPDLDVLLMPLFGELQKMTIHRGYSHSIAFCLFGAFFLAYFLSKFKWTKAEPYRVLWFFSFLGLFTHVLLDAFTSFGTQLFLPFTDWRVSFDSISIIDPFYTVPLLLGLAASLYFHQPSDKKRGTWNRVGLIVSSLYLLFTLANKENIQSEFGRQLEAQNIPSFEVLTVPVKVGNMVWYGVARDKTHLHIGKYSILKGNEIEFHRFPINRDLLTGLDEHLADKLMWYAKGFYTVAEEDGKIRVYNMQCDMQGVREYGDQKVPTAFYFEITTKENGEYELSSGMHMDKKERK